MTDSVKAGYSRPAILSCAVIETDKGFHIVVGCISITIIE